MKRFYALHASALCLALAASGLASAAGQDSRLRTVAFDDERVVPVQVEEGFAVQIVLGNNERIEAAGTGADSHCDDANASWCVVARRGEHDVYVNMHHGAAQTNLFVQTNLHNYSFDLIPAASAGRNRHVYRVQFTYPDEIAAQLAARKAALRAEKRTADDRKRLQERLTQPPVVRNWNYTMQVMPGGDEIAPNMMYDDGRFTYIRFPNNREIPSIYMVSDDGSESLVQWHVDNDVMVVHRVAKRFVLRDGAAVVGLWNEAYDIDGVPPRDGMTVPGVDRAIRDHVRMPTSASSGPTVPTAPAAPAPAMTTEGIADPTATARANAAAIAVAKANAIADAIARSTATAAHSTAMPFSPMIPVLTIPSSNAATPAERNHDSEN